MKLTTRGNYAISALVEMALNQNNYPISLKDIATPLNISENYLRQLFMQLSQNGIVKSVRGVSGGYYIDCPLDQISVLDIVQAVEGNIFVVPCLDDLEEDVCQRTNICKTKPIWNVLNQSIIQCLSSLSIQDLLETYNRDDSNPM